MCSYKVWILLTVIYSIPLILTLILSDVVTLVGLNAPHLFKYESAKPNQNDASWSSSGASAAGGEDTFEMFDKGPRLGEPEALSVENTETSARDTDDVVLNDQEPKEEPKAQLKDEIREDNSDTSTGKAIDTSTRQQSTTAKTASSSMPDDRTSNEIEDESRLPTTTVEPTRGEMQNDAPSSTDKAKKTVTESSRSTSVSGTLSGQEKFTDYKGKDELQEDGKGKEKEQNKKDDKDSSKKEKKGTDQEKDKPQRDVKPDESGKAEAVREKSKSEILKRSWNEFLDGLYANDNKLVLNIFVFIKIGFRVFSLITLPLLIIGNQTSRSTYVKPFKLILLLQFLFSLAITIYYGFASTECEYYRDVKDWLPKHFTEPDDQTGKNIAKLYLLITFADLFPYFAIVSLILIKRREQQIVRKKEESSSENNWDIQLRPIGLPRIKNTNSEHISPLNLHFNQPSTTHNDNLPLSAALITNEEISVNNQPFSYTSNSNQAPSLPCYENHGFNKN